MQHNNEETHRGLKRKPPHMDRGQERRPYNTNSRPYDRNTVPDGWLLFLFVYLSILYTIHTDLVVNYRLLHCEDIGRHFNLTVVYECWNLYSFSLLH